MAAAVRIHRTGGPEVLVYEEVQLDAPGTGEVQLEQRAIGLNFIDTYHRSGLYPAPGGLPAVLGGEATGLVKAVGEGVADLKVGDRVAYATAQGSYTTERNVPAGKLVKLPDSIDFQTAAAMMLKGMTAQYLLRQTFPVQEGHTILFHAAAGGVGLIACQWARHLGATVIGTAGSPEKARLASENGCHHVIQYREEDFVARVSEITGGRKCDVVFDGVGKATFPASLDCVKPRGMFVSFGNASGAVDAFNILTLSTKGSLYCTRPTLAHYATTTETTRAIAQDLFDVVGSGAVKVLVRQTYPLRDAARAHADLAARSTIGSSVLLP